MENPVVKYYKEITNNELFSNKISESFDRLKKGHTLTEVSNKEADELLKLDFVSDGTSTDLTPFVINHNHFYFQKYHRKETDIIDIIKDRMKVEKDEFIELAASDDFKRLVQKLFNSTSNETDWQKIGAVNCFIQNLSILSGGPGTGKTTTVAKFLALLLTFKESWNITLVAQTGKAATRLKESIMEQVDTLKTLGVSPTILDKLNLVEPSTIHRLLKTDVKSLGNRFIHNSYNHLSYDVVLVDEASMIDLSLMHKLLSAIKPEAKIVFLGDKNQLSPVEAGSVFSDITAAMQENTFNTSLSVLTDFGLPLDSLKKDANNCMVQLLKTYRFGGDSTIHRVSQNVLSKSLSLDDFTEMSHENFETPGSAFLMNQEGFPDKTFKLQLKHFENYIEKENILDALKEINTIRILCATNNGDYGINNLNTLVEKHLSEKNLIDPTSEFYHNQLIMITQNDYQYHIFNGDVGIVRRNQDNVLNFYIEDQREEIGYRVIPVQMLKEWKTSYAMTIHKSQGSQFKQVVICLPKSSDHKILSRELLYTAITRSSNQVFIYSSEDVLNKSIESNLQQATGIQKRLTL